MVARRTAAAQAKCIASCRDGQGAGSVAGGKPVKVAVTKKPRLAAGLFVSSRDEWSTRTYVSVLVHVSHAAAAVSARHWSRLLLLRQFGHQRFGGQHE